MASASTTSSAPSPSPSTSPSPAPMTPRVSDSDIVASNTDACISWSESDGIIHYIGSNGRPHSRLRCDIRYESTSQSTLFKLQLPLLLRPQLQNKSKSKNTALLFLFIPPENIDSLSLADRGAEIPTAVKQALSVDAVRLHFVLSSPPIVVGPQQPNFLVPKNKEHADVLASLQSFARRTDFALYVSHRIFSRPRLQILCAAISNHRSASIDQYSSIARLYGGKGGRVLESSDLVASDTQAAGAPVLSAGGHTGLPSYEELGPGPPPPPVLEDLDAPAGRPSQKRRRRHSSSPYSSGGEWTAGKTRDEKLAREMIHQLCGMEDRLMGRLDQLQRSFAEQLQEHKRSVSDMVEQRLEEHQEQTQRDLELLRREVDYDVEEQLLERKCELEQQFKDERSDLESDLKEQLQTELAELEENLVDRMSTAKAVLQFDLGR